MRSVASTSYMLPLKFILVGLDEVNLNSCGFFYAIYTQP